MDHYLQYLADLIPDRDSLKLVKTEAKRFYAEHTAQECRGMYPVLYQSENFQIQEVGVLLAGHIADAYQEALVFLRDTVSLHESWKVQEVLAMAFDLHCAKIGYENALPVIKEWSADSRANVRRAVSEGLRVWTSRPYFKEHPQEAIALLAGYREDESLYARKSAGNALRDISKRYPELIRAELAAWDLSSERTMQVYKAAAKFLDKEKEKPSDKKSPSGNLTKIPGVGANMQRHLQDIGIHCVADLAGKDPEELYRLDCLKKGFQDDRCVLYVFRCAVYYAEHTQHDPEKLKWWYWKDKEYPEKRSDRSDG